MPWTDEPAAFRDELRADAPDAPPMVWPGALLSDGANAKMAMTEAGSS